LQRKQEDLAIAWKLERLADGGKPAAQERDAHGYRLAIAALADVPPAVH